MIWSLTFILQILLVTQAVRSDDFQKSLGALKPSSSPEVQAKAVMNLISRLIGDTAVNFTVGVVPILGPLGKDTFRVNAEGGMVTVTGSSGVAAAWGFHHYLKYYCGCHVSWNTRQLALPSVLPDASFKITSNDRLRYYQNVCTSSYSFAWWDWKRWEQEIDWMALNGINLALAFTAQEAIWKRVYRRLNFTDEDLTDFFTGPAFLAWNRMGNIQKWAGPLPESWDGKRLQLQHSIFNRMQELGITAVLPAFSGHVPAAFIRVFPSSKVSHLTPWGHFTDPSYCCTTFLDPTESVFQVIGRSFIKEMVKEFNGTNHVYSSDPFNEMTPPSLSLSYLKHASRAIYQSMKAADKRAVWMVQAWMFLNSEWTNSRVKSFVGGVPLGRMLLLDLASEVQPQYIRTHSYFGHPFIWCMLHNYGGTLGLYGVFPNITTEPFVARNMPGSSMVGTGLTPEGINTNYVVYDLMNEMAWRHTPPNVTQWLVDYAGRRYIQEPNKTNLPYKIIRGWRALQRSAYNCTTGIRFHGKYIITQLPALNMKTYLFYDFDEVLLAWDMFVNVSRNNDLEKSSGFRHDLMDITREVLVIHGAVLYFLMMDAYKERNFTRLIEIGSDLLELLGDVDELLESNEAFLLGPWLEAAKSWADNDKESTLLEFNARNQITLWGPHGEIRDYATKQWSGLVSSLYRPRWQTFVWVLYQCLTTNSTFSQKTFTESVLSTVETPFTHRRDVFPVTPRGDTIDKVEALYAKYRPGWRELRLMPTDGAYWSADSFS